MLKLLSYLNAILFNSIQMGQFKHNRNSICNTHINNLHHLLRI